MVRGAHHWRGYLPAGAFALGAAGRGVQAVAAQLMLTGDGRVFEIAQQPCLGRERQGGGRRVVGLVAHHDMFVVGRDELGIAQRATAQVAREISQYALAVGVTLAQPHVPLDAPETVEQTPEALGRKIRRQLQPATGKQLGQQREQLAPEQRLDDARGQEVAAPWRAPLAVMQAAIGGKRVNMRVQRHGARPGMQCQMDARNRAEITRVGKQLGQCVGHCIEHRIGHQGAVVAPDTEQFMRESEDDMVVGTGQQARAFMFQPGHAGFVGATRAQAVFAAVPDDVFGSGARATLQMPAHFGTPAAGDQRCRFMLVQRQFVVEGEGWKMTANDG